MTTALFLAVVSLSPSLAWLYTSPWAVALWSITAVASALTVVRARLWRCRAVFMLHVSLLVILAGALTTHIAGGSQRVHVSVGEAFEIDRTRVVLDDFHVEYYPATSAPADFVARLRVGDDAPFDVSMNHTGSLGGARIFLSSYDPDRSGCSFTVSHDRAGTAVTYTGYGLLLLSMIAVSCRRRLRPAALLVLGLCAGGAAAAPPTVPRQVADRLGDLFVYHNGRVAPLSTLARDFTVRIYGSAGYDGLTPEQVLAGWLFYYDSWKIDPGIKIKDAGTRRAMGLKSGRASLGDFFGPSGYLFDDADHAEANEKFALVSAAATGSLWKIFPYSQSQGAPVEWYSSVDHLPESIDVDSWRMTRHSVGYLGELVVNADWQQAVEVIGKIGKYQRQRCGDALPSVGRVSAERWFLRLSSSLWPMIVLLLSGIVLIVWPRRLPCRLVLTAGILWVALLIALNAYASHHLPMANGYETMQWMALVAMVVCLWLGRRHMIVMPVGAVVAALALAVTMMGQRSPQLTNLMPVLRSPLLSVHVLAVMAAYALLAIVAVISLLWLCGHRQLLGTGRRLLRPAVFLMMAGIFIGAVWANVSWGRYWGWDPKEVWALITMMVYAVPLHRASLPWFISDRHFAVWTLAAFATVLMTYLGVNFVLGGLHSYA